PLAPVLAASRDLDRFLPTAASIGESGYLRRYVDRVRKENAQTWPERFTATLATAPKEVFALTAASLKDAHGPILAKALAKLASAPDPDPEAFLELAKESFAGKFTGLAGAPEPFQIFERLLPFADRAER